MKLRSIICVSAIATATAASALTTTNTFARLPVTSSFTNTIVAIPLAGCGATNATIYVTNLVMTANLKAGDRLVYKDGSSYYAWNLLADGGAWTQMATSTDFGTEVTPSAESTALDCGKACWLIRNRASFTGDDKIYLFGQVLTAETLPSSVTVAGAASANAVAYTCIAKPSEASSLDLSTWHPANAAAGDTILVPDASGAGQKTYKYNGSAWTEQKQRETGNVNPRTGQPVKELYWDAVSSVTIPAGKGFMYGRKGTSSAVLAW